MKTKLFWQTRNVPQELRTPLKTLGKEYPIAQGAGKGVDLVFEQIGESGQYAVRLKQGQAHIAYDSPAQALRAVGSLLGGLVSPNRLYNEQTTFSTFGIMLDCSRNAVLTVDHVKEWMRQLALLGYNMVMLYTEDVYELDGEPWFGYQRGAYTRKELKAIDAYAARLNIEVIPCIQTLGHLARTLRQPPYSDIRDVPGVMLVGAKKTYRLIEKMIKHWRGICRTNRIHVGMDETHGLGTGRYRDLNGVRDPFDIFNEHLEKVVSICCKHGLKPMIWSDMYFRLGSKVQGGYSYYDEKSRIPQRVIDKIDKRTELVYWDYYHDNKEFYTEWIRRHRKMGKEPIMGSGIWTWNKFWHDQGLTERHAGPCIEASIEAGLKEIFFTQWGDNGAYCDHDSAFAGMAWCADKAYGSKKPSAAKLEKRFAAVCGGSYADHVAAAGIHASGCPNIWDDPLFQQGIRQSHKDDPRRIADTGMRFRKLAKRLERCKAQHKTGDLRYAHAVATAMADRCDLTAELLRAYRKKDKRAIRRLAKKMPAYIANIGKLEKAFRTMWLHHNKPEGMEAVQCRYGVLQVRYKELTRRLKEYANGTIKRISELDYKVPPGS